MFSQVLKGIHRLDFLRRRNGCSTQSMLRLRVVISSLSERHLAAVWAVLLVSNLIA